MRCIFIISLLAISSYLYAAEYEDYYKIPDINVGAYKLKFTPDMEFRGNAGCNYTVQMNGPDGIKKHRKRFDHALDAPRDPLSPPFPLRVGVRAAGNERRCIPNGKNPSKQ